MTVNGMYVYLLRSVVCCICYLIIEESLHYGVGSDSYIPYVGMYLKRSIPYASMYQLKVGLKIVIDENEIVKEFGGLNGISYHKYIDKFQSSELANESNFLQSIAFAEANYLTLLKNGLKPEQARDVLPLALKTELVMTGFSHEWSAFFRLRCDNHAHPLS